MAKKYFFIPLCFYYVFGAHINLALSADMSGCKAMGINLEANKYFSADNAFTDIAKLSMSWIRPWGSKNKTPLSLDANGYPKLIDAEGAQTIFHDDLWGRDLVNDNKYVLLYDGTGTLKIKPGNASILSSKSGRMVIKLKQERLGLLETATKPDDYIRNIRLVPFAQEKTYATTPYRDAYLKRWGAFPVWRFMEAMRTNNSTRVNWADAVQADQFGADKGTPLKDIIAMANAAHVSPWLNVPHLASDDNIKQMAVYVKANLKPNLKVYVEYSNEVWNGMFAQSKYAKKQGELLGLDMYQFYAQRALQNFTIWEQVFAGSPQLVRVLGTQFTNPWVSQRILSFPNVASHADALAVGYYFGRELGGADVVDKTLALPVSDIIDLLHSTYLPATKTFLTKQKAVADQYKLPLIAYEAGQHLVGFGKHPVYGNLPNYQPLTDKLIAVNRAPGMAGLYKEFYTNWVQAGGGLLVWYQSTGAYGKHGSWGLLENGGQNPADAPKYQSVVKMLGDIKPADALACKVVN